MENLAYLYVLAEEAALDTNLRHTATHTKNHQSGTSHPAPHANLQALEDGKAALEGDRIQPDYPTFYL